MRKDCGDKNVNLEKFMLKIHKLVFGANCCSFLAATSPVALIVKAMKVFVYYFSTMQKCANLVELQECCKMKMYSQNRLDRAESELSIVCEEFGLVIC